MMRRWEQVGMFESDDEDVWLARREEAFEYWAKFGRDGKVPGVTVASVARSFRVSRMELSKLIGQREFERQLELECKPFLDNLSTLLK